MNLQCKFLSFKPQGLLFICDFHSCAWPNSSVDLLNQNFLTFCDGKLGIATLSTSKVRPFGVFLSVCLSGMFTL